MKHPGRSRSVAERVSEHRMRLGLSEGALARQACMSPRYLRQVLQEGPGFDPGGFVRIATALGLSTRELTEGREDVPPGQAGPAPHPVLARLTTAECWERLGAQGVGRLALPVRPSPEVFPVNYAVDARTIVYRTGRDSPGAVATGAEVSFEADRIDDRASRGWSVLVTGSAERVEDLTTVRLLSERHVVEPWAGGARPVWMRIRPETVTGRRITICEPHGGAWDPLPG